MIAIDTLDLIIHNIILPIKRYSSSLEEEGSS